MNLWAQLPVFWLVSSGSSSSNIKGEKQTQKTKTQNALDVLKQTGKNNENVWMPDMKTNTKTVSVLIWKKQLSQTHDDTGRQSVYSLVHSKHSEARTASHSWPVFEQQRLFTAPTLHLFSSCTKRLIIFFTNAAILRAQAIESRNRNCDQVKNTQKNYYLKLINSSIVTEARLYDSLLFHLLWLRVTSRLSNAGDTKLNFPCCCQF